MLPFIPSTGDPEKAMALLKSWLEEDDSDEPQAETWEHLKRVLDEDRLLPYRKLFPDDQSRSEAMSTPKLNVIESLKKSENPSRDFKWQVEVPLIDDAYINLPVCDVPAALEFLRYLREEDDADEQRETFSYLQRVLDEDRLSDRKLFS